MPVLVYETPRRRWVVGLDPGMARGRTLLAIARACRVPVLFNCESGDCGACLVKVVGAPGDVLGALTDKERFLLGAMGKRAAGGTEGGATPAAGETAARVERHRLACQATAGEGDLVVRFDTGIGGA